MKLLDYLMIIGIILILIAGVLMVLYFKNEGMKCLVDPITYYQLKEDTSCFCANRLM